MRHNFVAKNAKVSGAGTHEAKRGQKAKRCRQKREFKKEMRIL
jgi:hypothetical protein